MPAVRSIVSGLQGMVDVLNAMPDGVKRVIMIVDFWLRLWVLC